jgi:hypothetical protein
MGYLIVDLDTLFLCFAILVLLCFFSVVLAQARIYLRATLGDPGLRRDDDP